MPILCQITYHITIVLGGIRLRTPDQLKRNIQRSQDITKQNHVCKNGCYLFSSDDELAACPNPSCGENRYKEGTEQPEQTMTCVSIGAALAELLFDDETRDSFLYKSEADSANDEQMGNPNALKYTDIFSGKAYRELYQSGVINSNDICLIMYVDGFQHQHKSNHTLTMIHCIVMNLDPSVR